MAVDWGLENNIHGLNILFHDISKTVECVVNNFWMISLSYSKKNVLVTYTKYSNTLKTKILSKMLRENYIVYFLYHGTIITIIIYVSKE